MTSTLTLGAAAPPLALQDPNGLPLNLAAIADGHPLVLYFMRTADCVVCARHVKALVRARHEITRREARVAVVVPDGPAEAGELQLRLAVPFPVLSGRTGRAHAAFGLTKAVFGQLQQSGTILLDSDGIVRHRTTATVPFGAFDEQALLADLDALGQER